jgi:hypothetical protein
VCVVWHSGNKLKNVKIVYTPWANLKKTASMEVGQVSFHSGKEVSALRAAACRGRDARHLACAVLLAPPCRATWRWAVRCVVIVDTLCVRPPPPQCKYTTVEKRENVIINRLEKCEGLHGARRWHVHARSLRHATPAGPARRSRRKSLKVHRSPSDALPRQACCSSTRWWHVAETRDAFNMLEKQRKREEVRRQVHCADSRPGSR